MGRERGFDPHFAALEVVIVRNRPDPHVSDPTLWKAAHGASPSRIHPVAVSILWNDERGSCLFGMIDQWERGRTRRKRIYSSESLGLPATIVGNWDAFQLPAVGGTVFSPLPLLGLCDLLDEGVEDTPASLRRDLKESRTSRA